MDPIEDPAEQMRNLGICSGAVLMIVIAILGVCYYRINGDNSSRQPSGETGVSTVSTISTNSSQVSLSAYYQPPPSYDEVIKSIFEERRKSMQESLVENEELPPSYQEFIEKHLRVKK